MAEVLDRRAYYQRQARLARRAAARASKAWSTIDTGSINASWRAAVPVLLTQLVDAQTEAAATAATAPAMAGEAPASLLPDAFAGLAADGRGLDTLLELPVRTTLQRIGQGLPPARAMRAGQLQLVRIIRTEVADTARTAAQAAITATPAIVGYERIVVPPACARCVSLAGRLYPWNAGFLRHPGCDCQHRAVTRDQWRNDNRGNTPERLVAQMTPAQLRKGGFSDADQKALAMGADVGQLVNARRGAAGMAPPGGRLTAEERLLAQNGRGRGRVTPVQISGRDLYVTTEGTTTRGLAGVRLGARQATGRRPGDRYRRATAPRLLPQSIFQIAGNDRDEAVRLLQRNGYIH